MLIYLSMALEGDCNAMVLREAEEPPCIEAVCFAARPEVEIGSGIAYMDDAADAVFSEPCV